MTQQGHNNALKKPKHSLSRPVASGGPPPQFLPDQLTLRQQGGRHIIPTRYYVPPWIFRPCDGPVAVAKVLLAVL